MADLASKNKDRFKMNGLKCFSINIYNLDVLWSKSFIPKKLSGR